MGGKPSKDMAVCIAIFNPCKTKRIIMNYLYITNQLKNLNIPIYTIELLYNNNLPEIIGKNVYHVNSNSYMFHKENLYRLLEKKVPSKYKKLLSLDGDVYWNKPDWYQKISKLLDNYDVIHPFEKCNWLELGYKKIELTRKSIVTGGSNVNWDWSLHPGFCWAMRREWYNKVGFFDKALTGSGDTLSVIGWLKLKYPNNFHSLPFPIRKTYIDFYNKPSPRITYLKDYEVFHLYHGSKENRQYVDRHKILNIEYDIDYIIKINSDGVIEWKDNTTLNNLLYNYFENRNDDDPVINQNNINIKIKLMS